MAKTDKLVAEMDTKLESVHEVIYQIEILLGHENDPLLDDLDEALSNYEDDHQEESKKIKAIRKKVKSLKTDLETLLTEFGITD